MGAAELNAFLESSPEYFNAVFDLRDHTRWVQNIVHNPSALEFFRWCPAAAGVITEVPEIVDVLVPQDDYMNLVITSPEAIIGIASSKYMREKIESTPSAKAIYATASSAVMAEALVTIAALSGSYPDMDAIANDPTAMAAVAASNTAMAAVAASSTAMAAVAANSTAMAAVIASSTAMAAVAASSTAMAAVFNDSGAKNEIWNSAAALSFIENNSAMFNWLKTNKSQHSHTSNPILVCAGKSITLVVKFDRVCATTVITKAGGSISASDITGSTTDERNIVRAMSDLSQSDSASWVDIDYVDMN
jgi:hypothetical protein